MKTSFGSASPTEHVAKLVVVPASRRERLLEDGRVRGHADDGVLLHEPRELARFEHLARERVDPDADAVFRELVQSTPSHSGRLPRDANGKHGRRMADMTDAERRSELGQQFRVDSIRMSAAAKSGHPTSAMSAADLLAVLVDGYLRYDFDAPKSPANDRLIFSKGHASTLLYSIYLAAGVDLGRGAPLVPQARQPARGAPDARASVGRRRHRLARTGAADRGRDGARREAPRPRPGPHVGALRRQRDGRRARCGRRSSMRRTTSSTT